MKLPLLPALAALAVTTGGSAADPPAAIKDAYVRVRVEVEVRGVLKATDRAATVTTRYPLYERRDDGKGVK